MKTSKKKSYLPCYHRHHLSNVYIACNVYICVFRQIEGASESIQMLLPLYRTHTLLWYTIIVYIWKFAEPQIMHHRRRHCPLSDVLCRSVDSLINHSTYIYIYTFFPSCLFPSNHIYSIYVRMRVCLFSHKQIYNDKNISIRYE